jgi:hypothetical protein
VSFNKPLLIIFIIVLGIASVVLTGAVITIRNDRNLYEERQNERTTTDATVATSPEKETATVTATSPETETETVTETEHNDEPLWNVSPIDRINVDPLPEDAYYSFRYGSQITINTYSDSWYCYFSAYEISEEDKTIEKYAADNIAFINDIHDWQNYTFKPEEPVNLTIDGFDAVLYKTELYSNYGGEPYLVEQSRLYFIKSENGFYELDFRCETAPLSDCEPDWDYIISNVKIDDELKPEDVTTIFVSVTGTH